MFKAKLIANPSFIFFRKHSEILHILVIFINVLIINWLLNEARDWRLLLLVIPAYILVLYAYFKIGRKVMNSMQDRSMELNTHSIRILNKTGMTDFEISDTSIEAINLQNEYKYERSFRKELIDQFKGVSNYHFIQIYSGENWYTLRFMLDSIYMESKLNEVIQHWISLSIPIIYSKDILTGSYLAPNKEIVK